MWLIDVPKETLGICLGARLGAHLVEFYFVDDEVKPTRVILLGTATQMLSQTWSVNLDPATGCNLLR